MSKENQKLKQALKDLEQIVKDLQNTEIDVDAGLKKFKEGVKLVKYCRSELKTAENEFKELKESLEKEEEKEE